MTRRTSLEEHREVLARFDPDLEPVDGDAAEFPDPIACWGCGKHLLENQVHFWAYNQSKPFCKPCYMEGVGMHKFTECRKCGSPKKRQAPGDRFYTCRDCGGTVDLG